MKPGSDLLNTLNVAPKAPIRHGQPVVKQNEQPVAATTIAQVGLPQDDDLISQVQAASPTTSDNQVLSSSTTTDNSTTTVSNESLKPASTQVEPAAGKTSEWTMDSVMAEMRKAREEAKRSRLEKQDAIERLKSEYERKLEEIKSATQPLEDKAKELAALQAKEADKKRSLEERIMDREARLSEKDAEMARLKDKYDRELLNIKAELETYKSEINVQNQFYQEKLDEEIGLIPDKFKDFAQRMTKGCDSAREALEIIRDAKGRGMFKDKTTVVSHATPDAGEGARLSSESLAKQEREKTASLKPIDKIGLALKSVDSNPIFKRKK